MIVIKVVISIIIYLLSNLIFANEYNLTSTFKSIFLIEEDIVVVLGEDVNHRTVTYFNNSGGSNQSFIADDSIVMEMDSSILIADRHSYLKLSYHYWQPRHFEEGSLLKGIIESFNNILIIPGPYADSRDFLILPNNSKDMFSGSELNLLKISGAVPSKWYPNAYYYSSVPEDLVFLAKDRAAIDGYFRMQKIRFYKGLAINLDGVYLYRDKEIISKGYFRRSLEQFDNENESLLKINEVLSGTSYDQWIDEGEVIFHSEENESLFRLCVQVKEEFSSDREGCQTKVLLDKDTFDLIGAYEPSL